MIWIIIILLVVPGIVFILFHKKEQGYKYFDKGTLQVSLLNEKAVEEQDFELFSQWSYYMPSTEGLTDEAKLKEFPCMDGKYPETLYIGSNNHAVEGHAIHAQASPGQGVGLNPDGISFPIEFIIRVPEGAGHQGIKVTFSSKGKAEVAYTCPNTHSLYTVSVTNFAVSDNGQTTDKVFNSRVGAFTADIAVQRTAKP